MEDRKDKLISALMEYIYGEMDEAGTSAVRRVFVDCIGLTEKEINKYGFGEVLSNKD